MPDDYATIGDLELYARKDDIPTDYVKVDALDEYMLKSDMPDDYVIAEDLNNYVLKSELPNNDITLGSYRKLDNISVYSEITVESLTTSSGYEYAKVTPTTGNPNGYHFIGRYIDAITNETVKFDIIWKTSSDQGITKNYYLNGNFNGVRLQYNINTGYVYARHYSNNGMRECSLTLTHAYMPSDSLMLKSEMPDDYATMDDLDGYALKSSLNDCINKNNLIESVLFDNDGNIDKMDVLLMKTSTINTNTNTKLIYERINDDYEWIQYNKELRVIRSIKDDMYQMQSIIDALDSNKQVYHYFENQSTKDILDEFELEKSFLEIPREAKPYENRMNLPNGLRGYYVHRYLVNDVARWANRKYHLRICKLLDDIASREREELAKTIAAKDDVITEQSHNIAVKDDVIESQRPRMVPSNKENSYKYLIWKESTPDSEHVILHLVRRNKSNFRQVNKHFKNTDENWFYRENLPIAMTPNEDIKSLVKKIFPGSDYKMNGSMININKKHLSKLHEEISKYFDEFQF
ncbi:hypothetical protein M9Y10_015881 [Tritrichomonas musculus]|uniref:KilA-N domain-containing protein n=1 Tax=Tritrichomonas musculus TaxID=1915356 RepID=A0ABR2I5I6_9EUKA